MDIASISAVCKRWHWMIEMCKGINAPVVVSVKNAGQFASYCRWRLKHVTFVSLPGSCINQLFTGLHDRTLNFSALQTVNFSAIHKQYFSTEDMECAAKCWDYSSIKVINGIPEREIDCQTETYGRVETDTIIGRILENSRNLIRIECPLSDKVSEGTVATLVKICSSTLQYIDFFGCTSVFDINLEHLAAAMYKQLRASIFVIAIYPTKELNI